MNQFCLECNRELPEGVVNHCSRCFSMSHGERVQLRHLNSISKALFEIARTMESHGEPSKKGDSDKE